MFLFYLPSLIIHFLRLFFLHSTYFFEMHIKTYRYVRFRNNLGTGTVYREKDAYGRIILFPSFFYLPFVSFTTSFLPFPISSSFHPFVLYGYFFSSFRYFSFRSFILPFHCLWTCSFFLDPLSSFPHNFFFIHCLRTFSCFLASLTFSHSFSYLRPFFFLSVLRASLSYFVLSLLLLVTLFFLPVVGKF